MSDNISPFITRKLSGKSVISVSGPIVPNSVSSNDYSILTPSDSPLPKYAITNLEK